MKKTAVFLSLVAIVYCLTAQASVGNLYVSPNGNDAGNGTAENPLASLEGVKARLKNLSSSVDTIRVHIAGGKYFMQRPLTLDKASVPQAVVVFEGDSLARPVFYGGMFTGRFEPVSDSLWRVYIPEVSRFGLDFEQLYVNGKRRFRAQSPNKGEFYGIGSVTQTVLDSAGNRAAAWAALRVTPARQLPRLPENGDVLVTFYHKWDVTKKRLLHNGSDGSLWFSGEGMKPWNGIDTRTRFVVENFREALDSPGEWFLQNDGWLYYIPCEGETPENVSCMVPLIDRFLVISGDDRPVENISFKNISWQIAGYRTPLQGNEPAQAAAPIEAAVMVDFARNIRFEDCEIAHTGLGGIWFRRACSNCRIDRCHIHDLGAGGVKIGETVIRPDKSEITNRIIVDNCIIQHGGFTFPCAVGVTVFHASDNEITHNDIADFRYTGVSAGWVWGYADSPAKRNKIEYNRIHHLGWGELSDMGGVYTLGMSEGTSVSHNVIHHVYSLYYGGWGLYTDEGSTGITLENNLVYKCKSGGFHQHYGQDNIVRNNIFAGQIRTQLEATRVEDHTSFYFTGNIVYFDSGTLCGINWEKVNFVSDRNCFWDTRTRDIRFKDIPFSVWKAQGKDLHSVVADPGFTDPLYDDFTFAHNKTTRKIKFKPFDYGQAGVYGAPEWTRKAQLDDALLQAFDERVETYERLGLNNF